MLIHFVSHKLGRLLLPAALLVVLGASLFLPWPYSVVAVSAQVAFYGLAALDTILPERAPLKRLSSPIRTFVVLMAAAFCAPSILFLPQTLFWSRTEVRQTKVT
jgi:hypothetical protein